jgi:hypothetical protein
MKLWPEIKQGGTPFARHQLECKSGFITSRISTIRRFEESQKAIAIDPNFAWDITGSALKCCPL